MKTRSYERADERETGPECLGQGGTELVGAQAPVHVSLTVSLMVFLKYVAGARLFEP